MVRGLAAVLGPPLGALLLLPLLPVLPGPEDADVAALTGAVLAALLLALVVAGPLVARDHIPALLLIGLGAGLLGGAASAAAADQPGVNSTALLLADAPKALLAAATGYVLARLFGAAPLAVAVPLFVAGLGLAGGVGGEGPLSPGTAPDEVFAELTLPGLGAEPAGALALGDLLFLAMFLGWAVRHDLRPRVTGPLLVLVPAAALVVGEASGVSLPVAPLLALALLAPAADRLSGLVRGSPPRPAG